MLIIYLISLIYGQISDERFSLWGVVIPITFMVLLYIGVVWVRYFYAITSAISGIYLLWLSYLLVLTSFDFEPNFVIFLAMILFLIISVYFIVNAVILLANKNVKGFLRKQKQHRREIGVGGSEITIRIAQIYTGIITLNLANVFILWLSNGRLWASIILWIFMGTTIVSLVWLIPTLIIGVIGLLFDKLRDVFKKNATSKSINGFDNQYINYDMQAAQKIKSDFASGLITFQQMEEQLKLIYENFENREICIDANTNDMYYDN